ncbi:MAG: CBS domain-containing protein [Candidatus Hadarchaeaceae archaeon]
MKVAGVMSSPVIAITPTDPVARAKNLMLRYGVKRLVVIDRGKPIGVVSMRDLAERLGRGTSTWRHRPIDHIPVARVMKEGLVSVAPGTDLGKAAELMLRHGIGSLVVLDGKELAGIVTKTDLTRYFAEQLGGSAKVKELMSTEIVTADRMHSLAHVVELMGKHGISRVIVADGKKPIGVITESDIALAQLEKPAEGIGQRKVRYTRKAERADRPRYRYVKYVALLTAGDVMRPGLLTIGGEEDVARAASLMLAHGIGGLPVVDDGKLVGILTKTDLAKGIAKLGV